MRPSTVGDQPTRGLAGGADPGPATGGAGGVSFAMAALPAAFSFAHSTFCSEARSLRCSPSSLISCLARSLDCSIPGMLPPPPDCTDALWNNPAADGIPIRQVTFEPPPDCP